jgi:hypothetical protein
MNRARAGSRSAPLATAGAAAAALLGVVFLAARGGSPAIAEPPRAYELAPLPTGVDSATSLSHASLGLQECSAECPAVVYFWTPRMPLSRAGISHVARAAERVGARLTLVAYQELADYAGSPAREGPEAMPLADAALAAGALAHAPSLVVVHRGEVQGPAILGYKSAEAYEAALARRIGATPAALASPEAVEQPSAFTALGAEPTGVPVATPPLLDYDVIGLPGAYFRWVPGRQAVAYESAQRVYLLDLDDGRSRLAPGYIDFVPTPDGRYFVTPGPVEGGLTFFDADEVFEGVQRGRPGAVEPIFTDLRMRDQYPSVGILAQDSSRTLYRVMTSWFEGVVYRDYDVRVDPRSGVSSVQPVGEPVQPCAGVALSTPIMSPDGVEVAGRDEATGTTKIFRIREGGRCDAVADFGVPTSKVAWHRTGRKLAFSIPRRRRGDEGADRGIFVLDRDGRDLVRLPESENASRLAFPDFVGDEAVVFLVPGPTRGEASVFRVVELPGSG